MKKLRSTSPFPLLRCEDYFISYKLHFSFRLLPSLAYVIIRGVSREPLQFHQETQSQTEYRTYLMGVRLGAVFIERVDVVINEVCCFSVALHYIINNKTSLFIINHVRDVRRIQNTSGEISQSRNPHSSCIHRRYESGKNIHYQLLFLNLHQYRTN